MFLVEDQRHGVTNLVFTWEDPRKSGYVGNVVEGVTLDYDMEAVHSWSDGNPRPDSGIREVWYLPRGAAPDEIRLLELNDRLPDNGKAEAIDFGLDIEGACFRLFVADITSEQLDKIKQDPSRLPPGWSLEENRTWRRGHDRSPAVVPRTSA